jgi:2,4-dienoyl-CoA reductase-like NADH-dependent reductase (Old Yellow Enzyme family)
MITSGFVAPVEDDAAPSQVHVWDDRFMEGLEDVAQAVHAADRECRIFAQIGHSGRDVGPSDINWPWMSEVRALSTAEVEGIITSFARAIRRVQQAGWDGAELHGAHGYLLASFLSPYTNTRTDGFGGSVQKRVQIIADIMAQARELVGDDFPIQIKVNCDDLIPGGINMDNFPELAREIDKTGIDALNVSGNACMSTNIGDPEDQSFFLEYTEALNVRVPVILTGGNRSIELLEEILQQGKIDFLGIARPLIREPDLPARWLRMEGAAEADCISCNKCFNNLGSGLRCHQITRY